MAASRKTISHLTFAGNGIVCCIRVAQLEQHIRTKELHEKFSIICAMEYGRMEYGEWI